jgi:hypothetical protein
MYSKATWLGRTLLIIVLACARWLLLCIFLCACLLLFLEKARHEGLEYWQILDGANSVDSHGFCVWRSDLYIGVVGLYGWMPREWGTKGLIKEDLRQSSPLYLDERPPRREYEFAGIAWIQWKDDWTYQGFVYPDGQFMTVIRVPLWEAAVVSGSISGLMFWRARRSRGRSLVARRIRAGLCLECGYDLRASKERCPECGTPIPLDKTRHRLPGKDLKPPPTDPPPEPLPPG